MFPGTAGREDRYFVGERREESCFPKTGDFCDSDSIWHVIILYLLLNILSLDFYGEKLLLNKEISILSNVTHQTTRPGEATTSIAIYSPTKGRNLIKQSYLSSLLTINL